MASSGPATSAITGLVLAGGRGLRMGGVDKGLVLWNGRPLAAHAIERLRPQVHEVVVVANRNLAAYRALDVRVVCDDDREAHAGPANALEPYAGPLAGLLAGLGAMRTPWAVVVPCDSPALPSDLVARLAEAASRSPGASIAVAATDDDGERRLQPLFVLVEASARPRLAAFLAGGGRAAHRWIEGEPHVVVPFEDAAAFANFNRGADLAASVDAG